MYVKIPVAGLLGLTNLQESLVCSEHESTKGLIPKAGVAKFKWCTSVVALALLDSQGQIAPEILFPAIGSWNDLWSDDTAPSPELLGGE